MKAFRIGPTLAQWDGLAWLVTRETWCRVARDELEAEIFARQMSTEWGRPLDSSDRVDLCESS